MKDLFLSVGGLNLNLDVIRGLLKGQEFDRYPIKLVEREPNHFGGRFEVKDTNSDRTQLIKGEFTYHEIGDEVYFCVNSLTTENLDYLNSLEFKMRDL